MPAERSKEERLCLKPNLRFSGFCPIKVYKPKRNPRHFTLYILMPVMGRFVFLKMLLKGIFLASLHLHGLARLKIFLVLVGFISYVLGIFCFVLWGVFIYFVGYSFVCFICLFCFGFFPLETVVRFTVDYTGKIDAASTHLPLSPCTHLFICKAHFFLIMLYLEGFHLCSDIS